MSTYIDESLSFLKKRKCPLILVSRYEVDCTVVQLMENDGHFIYESFKTHPITFIEIKFFAVQSLEAVFKSNISLCSRLICHKSSVT